MLEDRTPQVESVQLMAADLAQKGDVSERRQVSAQLGELTPRWEDLVKEANDRQRALDDTLLAAKEFHDAAEPLAEWLDATEKKLTALENITPGVPQMESQIEQYKVN